MLEEIIEFVSWEKSSRDVIDVKRVYIDISGDLVAGVLLSQIVFWFLPDSSGKTKLTVNRGDRLWLAKSREDWWDECRITPKQFDRACSVLEEKGFIVCDLKKFNGSPIKHISLEWENLIQGVKSIFPKGQNPNLPLGNFHIPQRSKSYKEAETTTEITAETTYKPSLFTDSTDSTIQEPKHSERSKQGSSNCASKTGLSDPRQKPVTDEIFQQYRGFNEGDSPAWGGREGKLLKNFLKSHSDWTLQKVIMCVRNRFQSDENLSSDPVNWIAHLAKWAGGPLDKFGKPRSLDDGLSKDDKRNRASAIAIARGISNLRKGRGESFVPDRAELPAANYRGDDGIVDEDFEETDP